MVEIEKPRIECVENPGDGSYGKYVVEPLERGYGTTLGNSPAPHPALVPARYGGHVHQDRRRAA